MKYIINKVDYHIPSNSIASIIGFLTAIIGYHINYINGSWCPLFWAIVDFFFWPLAWFKWLICSEVNITIIKETFSFFFK